tara:strand:+ start:702 stop:956 length:255 start_codon:yes stop_codon:yes gene_type:complete
MMASDCNVGDLVLVDHDTYIFVDDKAFIIWKGTAAVVLEILDEDDDLNISEFSKGRRELWKGSLKIIVEDGRIGWCHAGNVIRI